MIDAIASCLMAVTTMMLSFWISGVDRRVAKLERDTWRTLEQEEAAKK